jgi:DNA modification methylase
MDVTERILAGDARQMDGVAGESVALVVTSPPYPMIAMWDECFAAQSHEAKIALEDDDGPAAFEAMHAVLDAAWREVFRVLVPGGIACIDIGDATRSVGGVFCLYANHARILSGCLALGFSNLPAIIWRKPTNAPNKFMGSGMLPPGAYVTLEHEYILILRKGRQRAFASTEAKAARAASAFFWEERNVWFSDVWMDLRGTRQATGRPATAALVTARPATGAASHMDSGDGNVQPAAAIRELRARSGAFPLELPLRLVRMFSLAGDTVLDPFAGTGTTLVAAAMTGRNGIGVESDAALRDTALAALTDPALVGEGQRRARERLAAHGEFVARRLAAKGEEALKHRNAPHGFAVMTRQEKSLEVLEPLSVLEEGGGAVRVTLERAEAPAGGEPALAPGAVAALTAGEASSASADTAPLAKPASAAKTGKPGRPRKVAPILNGGRPADLLDWADEQKHRNPDPAI